MEISVLKPLKVEMPNETNIPLLCIAKGLLRPATEILHIHVSPRAKTREHPERPPTATEILHIRVSPRAKTREHPEHPPTDE